MNPAARNTAKKIYVPQAQALNIGGTKNAMAKLLIQLLDAPIEAPLARIDSGKISETSVQDTGPQVAPKPAMYTQMNAARIKVSQRSTNV